MSSKVPPERHFVNPLAYIGLSGDKAARLLLRPSFSAGAGNAMPFEQRALGGKTT
jgi:hypothetical protein